MKHFFSRHGLFLICLFGFAIRIGVVLISGKYHNPVLWEYETIAKHIIAGEGFGILVNGVWYHSFGSPLFCYLCAGIYYFFGHSYVALFCLQALFSVAIVLGSYDIGRRLFSPSIGLLSALFVTVHPGLFFYDTHNLHPLSFDTALAVVGAWILLVLQNHCSWKIVFFAGVLHGLSLLERSTQAALLPLTVLSLWFCCQKKQFIKFVLIYGAVIAIVVSPWVVRNFLIYNKPVFVSTTDGFTLWLGNHAESSGGAFAQNQARIPALEAMPQTFRDKILAQNELGQREIFSVEARRYIFQNPLEAVKLFFKKLFIFWWFSSQSGILYPHSYLILYKIYYLFVLGFGTIGITRLFRSQNRGKHQQGLSLLFFLFSVSLIQAVFYVEIRHRWGIEPLFLIFTAAGAHFIADKWTHAKNIITS